MPDANWVQDSFLAGEWSKTAQGRISDPAYRIALGTCLNGIPLEAGAWTRRPGTAFAGTTRAGAKGRVVSFSFAQATPYTIELTDGHMQFRQGLTLIDTNDSVGVSSISTANAAVMTLKSAVTWASADRGYFTGLGTSCPLLQNRRFTITKSDTTHFSLADEVTGATIDGSTLGVSGLAATAVFHRALDIANPWAAGTWASVRVVLCDIPIQQGTTPGAVMLNAAVAPQLLQVATEPTPLANATLSFAAASFKDGPYLDPFTNGVQANANQTSGIVTITLTFPTYSATTSYPIGAFVTSSSINYESLIDQNVGNTPASSPSAWVAVSAGAAIGPNGFQGSDVGRLVRFFCEPDLWASGSIYGSGAIVSYNPSGIAGANAYYQSLVGGNVGNVPGTDATHWTVATNNPALWTWGKIVSLSNAISGTLSGSLNIGTLTGNAGLAAAFDGVLSKIGGLSATLTVNQGMGSGGFGFFPGNTTITGYVGKNYSGASNQKIQQVIIYPVTDGGFIGANTTSSGPVTFSMNLRGKASAPANSADGTLLGTYPGPNTLSPVTIISSDQNTAWPYAWVELVYTINNAHVTAGQNLSMNLLVSQVQFFNPPGTGTSTGVNVEILGAPLLYTTPIRTWRLGLFSSTTGWPTVGVWHEGRLGLAGVVNNRFDLSRANDPFNFAPTDQFGSVPSNAAIAYLLNSAGTNPILGMDSDERGIVIRTQAAEWLVTATTQNLPLSPTNIQAHPVTHYGSQAMDARRAGGVLVFVQRFGRKLLEYFADVFSGRQTATNLTRDAKQMTQSFLQEIAYQSELVPIIWGRRGDGGLVGTTYKRESMMSSQGPSFNGWHRHALGSGRTVESICAGPSTDGNLDTLTMVTNDAATGVRHVEVLTNIWEEGGAITSAWFLDDAVAPASYTYDRVAQRLTLNGLWHLNGKKVSAFVAGLDAGDYTVANGSISVQFDSTANVALTLDYIQPYLAALPAVVGFTYNSEGQVLRPGPQKDSGAATGPAFGKVVRAHQVAALLVDTAMGSLQQASGAIVATYQGIQFGGGFARLKPALLKQADGVTNIGPTTLYNGIHWAPVDMAYTRDADQLAWRISRPLPATIAAFGGFQHMQDQ